MPNRAAVFALLLLLAGLGSVACGNYNESADTLTPLTIAHTPDGWQDGPTKVRFDVDDVSPAETFYSIDSGPAQAGSVCTVRGEGIHTVEYWSVDEAGNEEKPDALTIKIDSKAPRAALPYRLEAKEGAPATIVLLVKDQASKARVTIKLRGPRDKTYRRTVSTNEAAKVRLSGLPAGKYVLAVTAVDPAGNRTTRAASKTLTVSPKPTSPGGGGGSGGGSSGGTLVGLTESGECYHLLTCYHWTKDPDGNWKTTVADAIALRYRPCSICDPPTQ